MSVNRDLNPQPTLFLPLTPWDKMMEIISAAGMFVAIFVTVRSWAVLPESIPRHFGISGEITAWGGKGTLIVLVVATILLYLGLSILGRYPQIYNYPWKITAKNAKMQYQIARNMVFAIKAVTVWIFAYGVLATIATALEKSEGLGAWFLPSSLTAVFGTIVISLYRLSKHR